MRKILSAIIATALALALFVPVNDAYVPAVSVTAEAVTVTKPVASVKSGTYSVSPNIGMTVDISCSDQNAQVYYSINGAAYKKAAYGYLDCVKIMKNTTLKLYAKTSKGKSAVVTYTYKLKPELKFSAKTTSKGKTVTITPSSSSSGVTLYYTTNGKKPTTKSQKYTSKGIALTKTSTVRVLAVKSGWTNAYYTKKYTISKSGPSTSDTSKNDTAKYISPKTGKSFTIPQESFAQISFDGTDSTVPAGFESHEPKRSFNYDTSLAVYLDGLTGSSSTEKRLWFELTSAGANWSKGTTLELNDMSSDTNYISLGGVYKYYMSYVGSYSNYIFSNNHKSYFDDAMFKIIDLGDSGKSLKYYFYLKVHDKSSEHVIEGVANVIKDAEVNAPTYDDNSSGNNNNNTNVTVPPVSVTTKCAVCNGTGICRVCDGTGKVWGWKQKVTCGTCFGKKKCPFCNNGYITTKL